jgi:alkanesulfonate monooxygenase SsuD/methylene tetrahydromethanopterin reductase-like flavin-dependent oxidoreductase (luciferase family)
MPLGAFVSAGRSLDQALARVRLAEELGYDSVWTTHLNARDSLTLLAGYAAITERVRLGTGVVPIYSRTPATMAQTAATIDEASGGRFVLGIGVSHRPVVEGWHGQTIDKPATEMREYVAILRAILAGEDPPPGEKFRTGFRLGMEPPPRAADPRRRAQPPHAPPGRRDRRRRRALAVQPGVRARGRRARGPRRPRGGGQAAGRLRGRRRGPAARTGDRDAAYAAMRRDLLTYFSLPFYRAMIDRSGFGADLERFDAAAAAGDGDAMQAAISDGFLDGLTAVGDDDAVRAGVRRYADAGVTLPCVGPIARTDVEQTLRVAAAA